jgi:hypothetical protein
LPSSLHTVVTAQRSVPPPTDAFWNASESAGWKVRTFKRSSWTKKEKEIDGEIIAEATSVICETDNSIIAIVGGDGDFLPVIRAAERRMHKNHSIEIWSWRHSLSQKYVTEDEEYPHRSEILTVRYLDNHIGTIGYPQREYNLSVDRIPRDVSLVAVGIRHHDLMHQFVESFAFPVYYLDHGEDKIIIPVNTNLSAEEFYNIFKNVESYFEKLGDPNPIIPYIQYLSRHSLESGNEIAVSNSFGPLLESSEEDEERDRTQSASHMTSSASSTSTLTSTSEGEGEECAWLVSARTEIKAKKKDDRIKARRNRCRYGFFCNNPISCPFLHSEDHVRNFKAGTKKLRKKCQTCNANPCRFSTRPASCNYLHPGEFPLCMWCAEQHPPERCAK